MSSPHLIEVAFKGNRKDFFLWDAEDAPPLKSAVIVEADRGEDLGYVHAIGELAAKRNAGTPHGYGEAGTTRKARRLATHDEVLRAEELREQDEDTRRRAAERVRANNLVMKLSDAEWQWDRKKLTLYFTAEKRVDFRTLVRELASMFRARIELKQIGVRDEAKRLDGIGRCGRRYCSSSWLPELRPVNLGVAKDQHLSLNPSQISGACGRLMCCLRYEHEFYVQSRKRFPKEGKVIRTKRGEEKVLANDIFRERVTLRGEDGEARLVPLAELREEMAAAGTPLPMSTTTSTAPLVPDDDDVDAELLVEEDAPQEAPRAKAPSRQQAARKQQQAAPKQEQAAPKQQSRPAEPSAASESAPASESTSTAAPTSDGENERRPHRRRGRRGGRRNRPSGRGQNEDGPDANTSAGGTNGES